MEVGQALEEHQLVVDPLNPQIVHQEVFDEEFSEHQGAETVSQAGAEP